MVFFSDSQESKYQLINLVQSIFIIVTLCAPLFYLLIIRADGDSWKNALGIVGGIVITLVLRNLLRRLNWTKGDEPGCGSPPMGVFDKSRRPRPKRTFPAWVSEDIGICFAVSPAIAVVHRRARRHAWLSAMWVLILFVVYAPWSTSFLQASCIGSGVIWSDLADMVNVFLGVCIR